MLLFFCRSAQRTGVGQRYLLSNANVPFLKKIKKRFTATADFHHSASKKIAPSKSSSSLAASTPQSEVSPSVSHDAIGEGETGEAKGGSEVEAVFQGEPEMHQKLVK